MDKFKILSFGKELTPSVYHWFWNISHKRKLKIKKWTDWYRREKNDFIGISVKHK